MWYTVPSNLHEYLMMMADGLVGVSSHTISATIMAICRLIFEFKGKPNCSSFKLLSLILSLQQMCCPRKKLKSKAPSKLGQEFKAKVRIMVIVTVLFLLF